MSNDYIDHMMQQAFEMEGDAAITKHSTMRSSMKVIVEGISTKEVKTKYGMKPTYSFKGNDGQWYSLGFKKPAFSKGEEVEFEFDSTKFGNQVTAVLSSHTGSGPVAADATKKYEPRAAYQAGGKGVFPIPATDGQRSIIRQNALTNARELVVAIAGGVVLETDATVNEILRVAKKFEAYTAGDSEAVAAKKALKEKEDGKESL